VVPAAPSAPSPGGAAAARRRGSREICTGAMTLRTVARTDDASSCDDLAHVEDSTPELRASAAILPLKGDWFRSNLQLSNPRLE
jgi:hypothetical protein